MLRLAPSLAVRDRYGRAPTARPYRPLRRAPLRRAFCGRGCSGDHPAGPCALSGSCESQPPHRAHPARPCALGSPRESQPPHHATAITPPQHHLRKTAGRHIARAPPRSTLRPPQPLGIAAARRHRSSNRGDHPKPCALGNPTNRSHQTAPLQQPRQSPRPANLYGLPRPRPASSHRSVPSPSRTRCGRNLGSARPLSPCARTQPIQSARPNAAPPASPGRSESHRVPHPVAEQVATRPHPSERRPRHRPGPAQPWYPATIFVNAYFGCEIPLHSPPPEQSRLVAQKVNRPRWWLEA